MCAIIDTCFTCRHQQQNTKSFAGICTMTKHKILWRHIVHIACKMDLLKFNLYMNDFSELFHWMKSAKVIQGNSESDNLIVPVILLDLRKEVTMLDIIDSLNQLTRLSETIIHTMNQNWLRNIPLVSETKYFNHQNIYLKEDVNFTSIFS